MKHPSLTIAIPTYNRAKQLDRQLGWAVGAIANRWDEVELIVSDNASSDETPEICQKWHAQTGGHVRTIRQSRNIGLIRNCLFCIGEATGDFVWTVSDDDIVLEGTLNWILSKISSDTNDQLTFLHLNGCMSNSQGIVFRQYSYPFRDDQESKPGRKLFETCVDFHEDWLLLITANAYRTIVAQEGIRCWPQVQNNLAFPLFLAGYAAAHGTMMLRSEVSLIDMVYYSRPNWLAIVNREVPEIYKQLANFGYTKAFIRRQILKRLSFLSFILKFPTDFLSALPTYWFAFRLPKH